MCVCVSVCVYCTAGPDAIGSKAELAKTLGLERPLKKNKDKGDFALKSCLEVLSEFLATKTREKAGVTGRSAHVISNM